MPEPTLATLFAHVDPARTANLEPVAPDLLAAAVHAVHARTTAQTASCRDPRAAHALTCRPVQLAVAGLAAAAVMTGGVMTWPHRTGQPSSSAWGVTPHADHTVTINIGTDPGSQAIADRLHTGLQNAGLNIPVYLTARPGQCTTPLHQRIANNSASPAITSSRPHELTINPDNTPLNTTLVLEVDEGQPSLGGVFIIGPLPTCIPYSDSPADGGVTPIQDR